ncbi:MAG: AURKAIP1/COX24 domain-containing protein [Nitrospira sp.]|nr:AURKAIP1/COX24 domain-containing protein [Nitrospira sp.]
MGSVVKWRKKKMSKHKHSKLRRKMKFQRRKSR